MAEAADAAGVADKDSAAETAADVKARKEREKDELYALDISDVEWHSAPGTEEHEERVEIAHLPEGAVAMRSSSTRTRSCGTRRRSGGPLCWGRATGSSIWSRRRTVAGSRRSRRRAERQRRGGRSAGESTALPFSAR